MAGQPNVLIVTARFYEDIADALLQGTTQALDAVGATYEIVEVPGVLEIPAAIAMAIATMKNGRAEYDGFVTLGCVIRGETTHYEMVCEQSARALMDLTVNNILALGNGIQTVENTEQAWARARATDKNKGGAAANTALAMITLRKKIGT